MANITETGGWAVAVWTSRLGGGQPMLVLYASAFADKQRAVDLIRERKVQAGDEIGEAYPLSKVTIDALGMQPGECDML